jgi:phthiocerol/phenolphthiocerol synthesis type-I polyketide synthase C
MTQEITDLLTEEIAKLVESTPEAIDIHKPLTEIGVDSLQGLQLIVLLERKYRVQIEESDLHHFTTVANITKFMHQILTGADSKSDADATAESYQ